MKNVICRQERLLLEEFLREMCKMPNAHGAMQAETEWNLEFRILQLSWKRLYNSERKWISIYQLTRKKDIPIRSEFQGIISKCWQTYTPRSHVHHVAMKKEAL